MTKRKTKTKPPSKSTPTNKTSAKSDYVTKLCDMLKGAKKGDK